jgi:hypothetical protein
VIPGTAATQLSLIATDEVAVAISGVRAYPNGFEFTIHALGRREDFPWGVSRPTRSETRGQGRLLKRPSGSASCTPTAVELSSPATARIGYPKTKTTAGT